MYIQPAGTAAVPNTTIGSTAFNNLQSDIGNELTNSLPTTGVKPMSANLPMAGNKVVNMADPSSSTDAATKNYVDTSAKEFIAGVSTGAAGAQVLATTAPSTFTLTAGNRVSFSPGYTNLTTLTLAVAGTAAINVFKRSATGPIALIGGEVVAGQRTTATYDGTQYILNEPSGNTLAPASFTDSGPLELTGIISPTALPAGSTNNYNPTAFITSSVLRLTGNSAGSVLTGLLARNAGTFLYLTNIGTGTITLLGNNAGSSAGNLFLISSPIVIPPSQSVNLWYDITSAGWRCQEVIAASPPAGSRKNLAIKTTSVTSSTITADELVLEGAFGNTYRAPGGVNVSYATGTSGAGGIDTGSVAASNWYFEYVIYNATTNTQAALISLSSTAPTMPSGYTFMARVGAIYYDAGSKLRFKIQYGNLIYIQCGVNPTVPPSMASGVAGDMNIPTWVGVNTSAFVPSTSCAIILELANTGSSYTIMVNPNNTAGIMASNTNPPWSSTQGVSSGFGPAPTTVSMPMESSTIYWATDSSNSRLLCRGWVDNL